MPDPGPPAVLVDAVTVRYGATTALSDISFSLDRGIVGLVGPNGAGKTTLLSTITGIRSPDAGDCRLLGHALSDRRSRRAGLKEVGYLPQSFDLAPGMTVRDTVAYAGWSNGLTRKQLPTAVSTALRAVDLEHAARHRTRTLSGGERQRLGLAAAAAHRPRVLVLDEPTVGLDPAQRLQFRDHLHQLSTDTLVLLATHLLEDIDHAAHRVLVLRAGELVFDGSVGDLASRGRHTDLPAASELERGYLSILSEEPT